MRKLQALLFDCDGVLVDTERDGHRVAFNEAFAKRGLDTTWSLEQYADLLHTAGGKERMSRFFNETQWPVAVEEKDEFIQDLHRTKTNIFMSLISEGKLPLRPGVERIMREAVSSGVTIAVCSTSNERAVQSIVDVLLGSALSEKISVFAGDMVKAKKPDPSIYLMAVEKLQLDLERCLVIEDSHVGLSAANAAGINCLVTKSFYTEKEDFQLATKVITDLEEGETHRIGLSDLELLLV